MPRESTIRHTSSPSSIITRALHQSAALSWLDKSNDEAFDAAFGKASAYERELAEKVAKASVLLRNHYAELRSWYWPGSFDQPTKTRGTLAVISGAGPSQPTLTFWGCLPASTVLSYLDRIENTRKKLDDIEFEDLKEHIINSRARVSKEVGLTEPLDLGGLTALSTMLVLQALPTHANLLELITVWTTRLSVLRRVPDFFDTLSKAEKAMEDAWIMIGVSPDRNSRSLHQAGGKMREFGMIRDVYEILRSDVEEKVARLGRRTDAMLDILADHNHMLPDSWIDAVENLEIDYSSWTVEAQKEVMLYEFRSSLRPPIDNTGISQLPRNFGPVAAAQHLQRTTMTGSDTVSPSVDWVLPPTPDDENASSASSIDTDGTSLTDTRARAQSSASSIDMFIWPQVRKPFSLCTELY